MVWGYNEFRSRANAKEDKRGKHGEKTKKKKTEENMTATKKQDLRKERRRDEEYE